jgi:UDP-glucose 4,6-dehydratase
MADDDASYEPKSILLTGGCGFIGAHVVPALLEAFPTATLVTIDKLDYCANEKWSRHLVDAYADRYTFVEGDILDASFLRYLLKDRSIDTVMHFAAQSHVDNSFGNSLTFTRNNVLGTHVLLESCRAYGAIRRFVHVSTDEVYGTASADDPAWGESAMLKPTNPYSASKAAAEMIVSGYRQSYKMPIIITRGNNVYGPGQFPEKVVPKFTLQTLQGKPCTIHGNGANSRHYVHVSDAASAFVTVLAKGEPGEIYNIGTEEEISTLQVAQDIGSLLGASENLVFVPDRCFNDFRYPVDRSKLASLGWKPKVGWKEGLEATVRWYQENSSVYWSSKDLGVALEAHPLGL